MAFQMCQDVRFEGTRSFAISEDSSTQADTTITKKICGDSYETESEAERSFRTALRENVNDCSFLTWQGYFRCRQAIPQGSPISRTVAPSIWARIAEFFTGSSAAASDNEPERPYVGSRD